MGLDRRGANLPTVFQIRRLLAPAQLLGVQGNGFSEYVSVPQGCCFRISRWLPPLQTSHALSKQKKGEEERWPRCVFFSFSWKAPRIEFHWVLVFLI